MSDFYKYFKENMEDLGLPAPETLFGSVQSTVGTITVILGFVDKFGPKVTVGELIGAGTKLEKLGVIAACSAAFYAGAVIGSLAVAAGRCLGNGTSMADVLFEASRLGFKRPWLPPLLLRFPGMYQPDLPRRKYYRHYKAVK